jgi:hypothetical protein
MTAEPSADELIRAGIRLDMNELMARYARAVDGLAFDVLCDILAPDVEISYSWLSFGASEYSSQVLHGLPEVQAWLRQRLSGRGELRRFMSDLYLLEHGTDAARGSVQMHERDMRITGTYTFDAVRSAGGWRLRRLDLVEEIQWV